MSVRNTNSPVRVAVLVAIVTSLGVALDTAAAPAFDHALLSRFGSSGSQGGELMEPQGVAVDQSTHDVYVADAGNHRIEKFSGSGAFIAAWGWGVANGATESQVCTNGCQAGQPGAGAGQLTTPVAVAVDNSGGPSGGDVYVGDRAKAIVDQFSSSGIYLRSLSAGSSAAFGSVEGVATDARGNVWISDSGNEVYEFTSAGAEIRQWRDGSRVSRGIAVDAGEDVYVVDPEGATEMFSQSGERLGELDSSEVSAKGLAWNPASGSLLSDQGAFVAGYDAPATPPSVPADSFGEGTLADGAGLAVDTSSGDVFVADASGEEIYVFGPPLGPPEIDGVTVANVLGATELRAKIYTGQYDTKYYFEYGATSSYGSVVPVGGDDIGSGIEDVQVARGLTGLSAGTTYHYRVIATNSHGSASSGDHTFNFAPGSFAELFELPDDRGYELVTPTEKNGGDIEFGPSVRVQAALSGDAVTYSSWTGFAGSQSAKRSRYLSTRGKEGWTTQAISPPVDMTGGSSLLAPYQGFSEDLSSGVLAWPYAQLTPESPMGESNLYLRDNSNGSYRLITTAPLHGSEAHLVGASRDFSRIVFESSAALTPDAAPSSSNIYEWSNGVLSLVSIPPGSSTGAPEAHGGDTLRRGEEDQANLQNAVSSDGRLVFWTDQQGQLYVRESGVGTAKVNASQRAPSLGDGSATFDGATPDGELVLFSDATALTGAPADHGGLYELNTSTGELTDLTLHEAGSPGLQGVLGFGRSGSYVYLVADERLVTSPPSGAPGPVAGQPNLYVAHAGELSFIGTLSVADSGDWMRYPTSRHAAVTPDGMHVVFTSYLPLTGYDNVDAMTGKPDAEVFEYDAGAEASTYCVSCNPTGSPPFGSAAIPTASMWNYAGYYLSNDGARVFFDTADALTAGDTNGMQDLYEWERDGVDGCARESGCVYRISSGTDESDSTFLAAGEDGEDVFFETRSRLAPQDVDGNIDVYDARVAGGAPAGSTSEPAQCADEACLGPLSAAPATITPLTALPSPSQEASEASPHPPATFAVATPSRRALKKLAETGRLTLVVTVSQAGEVWARMATKVGRRIVGIASGSARAHRPAKLRLGLTLTKYARARLAAGRRLPVTLTVGYSRVAARRLVGAVLSRSGSGR